MDPGAVLLGLLGSANLSSRRAVFEQYDSTVGADTVAGPGRGAAVLRVKGTTKALVATTDGNQAVGALDPWLGAALCVAEATRNVSITGARPLGVTNCLNYGDPDAPRGVLAAHRGRPRPGRRVPRARPAGHRRQRLAVQRVAGRLDRADARDRRGRAARRRRHAGRPGVRGRGRHDPARRGVRRRAWPGRPTPPWPARPARMGRRPSTWRARRRSRRSSGRRSPAGSWRRAQDVSGGGLAVALAEGAMWGGLGAQVRLAVGHSPAVELFGESPSRLVVTRPTRATPRR